MIYRFIEDVRDLETRLSGIRSSSVPDTSRIIEYGDWMSLELGGNRRIGAFRRGGGGATPTVGAAFRGACAVDARRLNSSRSTYFRCCQGLFLGNELKLFAAMEFSALFIVL